VKFPPHLVPCHETSSWCSSPSGYVTAICVVSFELICHRPGTAHETGLIEDSRHFGIEGRSAATRWWAQAKDHLSRLLVALASLRRWVCCRPGWAARESRQNSDQDDRKQGRPRTPGPPKPRPTGCANPLRLRLGWVCSSCSLISDESSRTASPS
jgi:hypothetical protein